MVLTRRPPHRGHDLDRGQLAVACLSHAAPECLPVRSARVRRRVAHSADRRLPAIVQPRASASIPSCVAARRTLRRIGDRPMTWFPSPPGAISTKPMPGIAPARRRASASGAIVSEPTRAVLQRLGIFAERHPAFGFIPLRVSGGPADPGRFLCRVRSQHGAPSQRGEWRHGVAVDASGFGPLARCMRSTWATFTIGPSSP